MIKWITIIMLFFISNGCKKDYQDGFTIYNIRQGTHSSTREIRTQTSNILKFKARFDESAEYISVNPINQLDINKLYGFSECNQQHHENSARFGWRWINNQIEIHAYVYNNGTVSSKLVGIVNVNETHTYQIEMLNNSYVFSLNGNIIVMSRTNSCNIGAYYMLYPYFGGDEVAPHNIKILIKEERII